MSNPMQPALYAHAISNGRSSGAYKNIPFLSYLFVQLRSAIRLADKLVKQTDGHSVTTKERPKHRPTSVHVEQQDSQSEEASEGSQPSLFRNRLPRSLSDLDCLRTSAPAIALLGVHITGVNLNDMPAEEVFLELRLENHTQRAGPMAIGEKWTGTLVFAVANMEAATLRVRLRAGASCYTADCYGSVLIPLRHLANPAAVPQTETYPLKMRNDTTGSISLRLIPHTRRSHRPLRVLCCTWNMGNEQPSGDFDQWLRTETESTNFAKRPLSVQLGCRMISLLWESKRARSNLEPATQGHRTPLAPVRDRTVLGRAYFAVLGAFFTVQDFQMVDERKATKWLTVSRTFKSLTGLELDGKRSFWEVLLGKDVLNEYLVVKEIVMWQIRLLVLAHVDVFPTIHSVKTAYQPTGVGGVGQNKGGVGISLRVWDTHLCFVNAHLAAHQDRVSARNANYRTIIQGLRLADHDMDLLTGFHHVFWMGDLNYRIDFSRSQSPSPEEFSQLVKSDLWSPLQLDTFLGRSVQKRVSTGGR